jgi:7-cyano-7-deazaguanine synthase in queuosine biosynthesis
MAENINLPEGTIGLYLSGGIDSAFLLYLLGRQNKNKVVLLTIGTQEKKYNIPYAERIVKYVKEKTDIEIIDHRIVIAETEELRRVKRVEMSKRLTDTYEIVCWLDGKTMNPKEQLLYHEQRKPDRDRGVLRWRDDKTHGSPFATIDKQMIRTLIEKHEVGRLTSVTISCEVSDPACGKCWWCEERKWAFGNY